MEFKVKVQYSKNETTLIKCRYLYFSAVTAKIQTDDGNATFIICDPLCENPAKVILFLFYFFLQKIILHMVKNILWKIYLYIFNIDWVRSCQIWNYSEINGRNQTLMLVFSLFDFETSAWISQRGSHMYNLCILFADTMDRWMDGWKGGWTDQ